MTTEQAPAHRARWRRRGVIVAVVRPARAVADVRAAVAGVAQLAEQAVGRLAGHAAEWAPGDVGTPFSLQVRASRG